MRVLDRLFHIPHHGFFVVGDHHGAPAQHIGRPHHHRISNALCALDGLFERGRHHSRGLRNLQFFEQLVEMLAIFGQINGLRRGADDVHARRLQRQCQVQRRLSAKLHDHAHRRALRRFMLVNRPHIFKRQRLKVETVAGVVIGRDRFRIAIDHDRLVTIFVQRERGVTAAVIELNSLPDAVRPAAQNDDFLLVGRRGFVFVFVGRIKIWRKTLELRRAGVHALVHGQHAMFLAQMPDLLLPFQPPRARQPSVGKSHALGLAQHLGRNRLHRMLLQLKLHVVNFFELVEEPRDPSRSSSQSA